MSAPTKRPRRDIPGPVPVPSRWAVPERCQHTGASRRAVAERVYEALTLKPGRFTAYTFLPSQKGAIVAAIERAMGAGDEPLVAAKRTGPWGCEPKGCDLHPPKKKRPARRGGTDGN
jgi:hypothetical protein